MTAVLVSLSVLCFHLGMTDAFILDKGSPDERLLTRQETAKVLQDIHHQFVKVSQFFIGLMDWSDLNFFK